MSNLLSIHSLLSTILLFNLAPRITLASRTIMHNLMRKNIAVNAKVIAADFTRIPPTLTNTLDCFLHLPILLPVYFRLGNFGEG
jgi:hypothetical protein